MTEEYEGEIVVEEEITTQAIDTITRAEIDMQISTAKKYPRHLPTVKNEMVQMATLDRETAESCYYSLRRWDTQSNSYKFINGESIRLAEIALCCFGNIRAGTRNLGETEDGKFVRQLGVCHDVEKNVMVAREVTRRITTKTGKRYNDDMVGVTHGAASSIALRNAVFAVVPRALVKPAYNKAREVALGQTSSLSERRAEVIDRLAKLSPLITMSRVLGAVDKASSEEIGWPEVEHLIGLGTAIKDGVQTVDEAFPEPETATITPEDVLAEPQEQATLDEAQDKLETKRREAGIPEQMLTEQDGEEIMALAKENSISVRGMWQLIHETCPDTYAWDEVPASLRPELEAKIKEMGDEGGASQ